MNRNNEKRSTHTNLYMKMAPRGMHIRFLCITAATKHGLNLPVTNRLFILASGPVRRLEAGLSHGLQFWFGVGVHCSTVYTLVVSSNQHSMLNRAQLFTVLLVVLLIVEFAHTLQTVFLRSSHPVSLGHEHSCPSVLMLEPTVKTHKHTANFIWPNILIGNRKSYSVSRIRCLLFWHCRTKIRGVFLSMWG